MKSNYKRLGDYIRQVDIRNKKNKSLSVNEIRGISSITKSFVKTKANLIDVSSDNYKVVGNQQFAFNPNTARMGDKIPIGLNTGNEILVSSIYYVFEVDAISILPKYLLLWFRRPEFDRYARYHSHGSAREIFGWDAMCDVMLPVPPLAEQQKIVDACDVIENRIALKRKINDNLEAQMLSVFSEIFNNIIDEPNVRLSDLIDVRDGTHDSPQEVQKGFYLVTSQHLNKYNVDTTDAYFISEQDYNLANQRSRVEYGDILFSMIGTVGKICLITEKDVSFAIKNVALLRTSQANVLQTYILCLLKSPITKKYIASNMAGSTQAYISLTSIRNMPIKMPNSFFLNSLNTKCNPILSQIISNCNEIECLFTILKVTLCNLCR